MHILQVEGLSSLLLLFLWLLRLSLLLIINDWFLLLHVTLRTQIPAPALILPPSWVAPVVLGNLSGLHIPGSLQGWGVLAQW